MNSDLYLKGIHYISRNCICTLLHWRNIMKNNLTIKKTKIFFVIIAAILILFLTFNWFGNRLDSIISDTNSSFLMETSYHQSAQFNTKLTDQLAVLESLAQQFSNVDFNNYNELKNAILSLHDIGDFKQLTVADSSGACMSNNNLYSDNISKKHYFQTALAGQANVSNGIDFDKDGEGIFALSVPIYQKNEVVGVLTGIYDRSVLDSLFNTTMFNGNGYTYLVNSSGSIIIRNENVHSFSKENNYFAFLESAHLDSDFSVKQIKDDFANGHANALHYNLDGQERYAAYTPVGMHDWYTVSIITDEVILSQTQELSFITIVLIVVLVLLFIIVFLLIISTMQKPEVINMKSENSKSANAQNQSLIFDYHLNKKILDLSGNIDFIFREDYPEAAPIDLPYIKSHIHPDDESTFEKFLTSCTKNNFDQTLEFRFLCTDKHYYWFRLSSTLVKENNKPCRLIGNVTNVESQKNLELSSKYQAEHDLLTGLLNKKTLESYVNNFLRTQNPDSIHALFIVDLDNFKSVNDTLGHAFGDKVLIDASTKLFRIFSEKDYIGRISGDTFAAFLNLSTLDNLENAKKIIVQKGNALKTALHETYSGQGNREVTISASIGIALYSQDGSDYITLYNNAASALSLSKKQGKNSYNFYKKEGH